MKTVDVNALRDALYEADAITMQGVAILNNFPGVEAVEVVRCDNCRWYDHDLNICNLLSESKGKPNAGYAVGMDPDDFCSQGEMRKV